MTTENFLSDAVSEHSSSGTVCWESPSNIALVKYWGKRGDQLPANPSLSFSLNASRTRTQIRFEPAKSGGFEFRFDGALKPDFHPKLEQFFARIKPYIPFLDTSFLFIDSSNTFPHSTGIASSASAMSALALGLTDIERSMYPERFTDDFFFQKASFLARLGSGSAARSVYGGYTSWGNLNNQDKFSDLFASPIAPVHENFQHIHDSILIVSKAVKKVSSTAGHALMQGHPFAQARFKQAQENHIRLQEILQKGNWDAFTDLVETEALSLHAMMMTGTPSYFLMSPESILILDKIREFRKTNQVSCCFTLDAGPNVHFLYPDSAKSSVLTWIDKQLKPALSNLEIIHDSIGSGSVKIS